VKAQNQEVVLSQAQTRIIPGAAPQTPQPLAAVNQALVVSTGLTAVSAVCGPDGSSTGFLPNGLSFNQITGSQNILSTTGQRINVDQPAPGEYAIVVRSLASKSAEVNIRLTGTGTNWTYHEVLSGSPDGAWLIWLNVQPDLAASKVTDIVPLKKDQKIGHIIETKLALQNATPFATVEAPASSASALPEDSASPAASPSFSTPASTRPASTSVVSTDPVTHPASSPGTGAPPTKTVTSVPSSTPADTKTMDTTKPANTVKPTVKPATSVPNTAVTNTGNTTKPVTTTPVSVEPTSPASSTTPASSTPPATTVKTTAPTKTGTPATGVSNSGGGVSNNTGGSVGGGSGGSSNIVSQ
jgi:hypothetical protein